MKCHKEHTHEVIENFANGKSFWYCRSCKDEVRPGTGAFVEAGCEYIKSCNIPNVEDFERFEILEQYRRTPNGYVIVAREQSDGTWVFEPF